MSQVENCAHDCESCGESCPSRTAQQSFLEKPHAQSSIKKVIGVVSGKGGVGKSMVTALLAAALRKQGLQSAVMDADITGPSIPAMFGISQRATGDEEGLHPVRSKTGVDIMSINLLLDTDTDPVIWRGPVISGVVKQFWTEVIWEDIDVMFVDLPPGTGDVPLTVFQSLPLDGIIVVATPQQMVSMIVSKAVNMARAMNIPILGLVENMSYALCPDCGKKIELFGQSHVQDVAERFDLQVIGRVPIDPELTALADAGQIELFEGDYLQETAKLVVG